jgi:lauroyl/myristoyl acyltransferase
MAMRILEKRDLIYLVTIAVNEIGCRIPFFKKSVALVLGGLAFFLSKEKKREILLGLSKVFGPSYPELRKVAFGGFVSFWSEVFDLRENVFFDSSSKGIVVKGEQHLQTALRNGKGAILWESNSLGKRSLAKQILHQRGFHFVQVHADFHIGGFRIYKNTWLQKRIVVPYVEWAVRPYLDEIIYISTFGSLSFTRTIQKRLRQNCLVCSAGDGKLGQRTMTLPFLNQSRPFSPGMISLARRAGCPILPVFCFRNENGVIELQIRPPLAIPENSGRDEVLLASLKEYVSQLENLIRKFPGQYRHWHFGKSYR